MRARGAVLQGDASGAMVAVATLCRELGGAVCKGGIPTSERIVSTELIEARGALVPYTEPR